MHSDLGPTTGLYDREQVEAEGNLGAQRQDFYLDGKVVVGPDILNVPAKQRKKSRKELQNAGVNTSALGCLKLSASDAFVSASARSPSTTSSATSELVPTWNAAKTHLARNIDAQVSDDASPEADVVPPESLDKKVAPRQLQRSSSDPMLLGGGTEAFDATPPAPEALIVEQLEVIRLVLETSSSKFLDTISKQLQAFQQGSSPSPAEIPAFKVDLENLRVGGADAKDFKPKNLEKITHNNNGISATTKAITKQTTDRTSLIVFGTPPQSSAPATKPSRRSQPASMKEGHPDLAGHLETPVFDQTKHEQGASEETIEKSLLAGEDFAPQGERHCQGVFPDENQMKEQIRQAISQPEYKVENFYYDRGVCQRIARSPYFDHITLVLIAINALWISIEIDNNDASCLVQADIGFQLVEQTFCAYFVFELLIRFLAFRKKADCLKDRWFVFDSVLVTVMVCEIWIIFTINLLFPSTQPVPNAEGSASGDTAFLKMFRVLRLLRCARLIRLLRSSPELVVLIKAIFVAVRSVFFTCVLMLLIAYIFAIAFTLLTAGSDIGNKNFGTVPTSMKNLLLYACFPDLLDIFDDVGAYDIITGFIFLVFLLLVSLTILNMLVGILVQVIAVVSTTEQEKMVVEYVRDKLTYILKRGDADHNELIGIDEFRSILLEEKVVKFLTSVGVDVVALVDYVNVVFSRDSEFEYADIITFILQLRGSNQCTVKDVVDLRQWIGKELSLLRRDMFTFEGKSNQRNGEIEDEEGALQPDFPTKSVKRRMPKKKRTTCTF